MKKELFLIGALAAVLISGCAVAGKNADDSNSTSIGTTIYDENSGDATGEQTDDENGTDEAGNVENGSDESNDAETGNGVDNTSSQNNSTETNNNGANAENTNTDSNNADNNSTAGSDAVEFDVVGHYVDKQGTPDDIYSDIYITKYEDSYYAEISIFRLTTLAGTCTRTDKANVLEFTQNDDGWDVKGTIECSENGAVFTVTESGSDLLKAGEVIEFPEKMAE